ncbi:SMI1/KNR4 family protein [Rossellomorea marisflavi]|uniref:SMI1/KNR4 family protein n=1 Tax=Rossellomorea marisflavi TaxID=189381 RepID=UPI003FA05BA6
MNIDQLKEMIRHEIRELDVKSFFVAPINVSVIEQFEQSKFFTLPDDYWWFLRNLGQGGVDWETLGIVRISEHLHIFHGVKEAKYKEDVVPIRDFIVIEHLNENDFLYIETPMMGVSRVTAPILRWNHHERVQETAYSDFYTYFLERLKKAKTEKKRGDKNETT